MSNSNSSTPINPTVPTGPRPKKSTSIDSEKLTQDLAKVLDAHKAENIEMINLDGKTDIADYMIIATGRSDRHIQSLADYACKMLKELDLNYGTEGMATKNWVLVDTGQVLIHLFTAESRENYRLEDLWKN
jgi:ribosome-associated protein